MAANLRSRGLGSLGKRLAGQIQSRDSVAVAPLTLRSLHSSVYDKNPEESAHSAVVPDHIMPPETDEYWAPHPMTGVFGPASDGNPGSGQASGGRIRAGEGSVLEQKAFFRPQEDLDKPPVQP